MKRLIVNIILLIVAIFLLSTIGVFGAIFGIIWSAKNFNKVSFIKYWTDTIYSINIGIDRIGNVVLGPCLNSWVLIDKTGYSFGSVNDTISRVLAVNYFMNNITTFGKILVWILEKIDKNHMNKSLR
jgi:hypothetical protein